MEKIYIRRCVNGKSFAAAADPEVSGLGDRKCPFFNEAFEPQTKEVNAGNAEIMGINFEEAVAGVQKDGVFFGKFKMNLGETMIL